MIQVKKSKKRPVGGITFEVSMLWEDINHLINAKDYVLAEGKASGNPEVERGYYNAVLPTILLEEAWAHDKAFGEIDLGPKEKPQDVQTV